MRDEYYITGNEFQNRIQRPALQVASGERWLLINYFNQDLANNLG